MQITPEIADVSVLQRAIDHAAERHIVLPTFSQLADPASIPVALQEGLSGVDRNAADPRNLFRIHWYNRHDGGIAPSPLAMELPGALTGVRARIVVVLGDAFPMIAAHKVLAAYACLVTRLVSGRFDPGINRAVWPSTGNYCRGGIAISRILGCRGVAVLPEEMSRERFNWLEEWTLNPDQDIIRTTGSESNVREIYEACDTLAGDADNVILNQFSEFANYLCHRRVTGPALARVFETVAARHSRLRGFITGTGSAGTIAAGDHLKQSHGAAIIATEPLECPTLLNNGYGAHGIQGIGDKHVPLIHNVMNMDAVVGVSDVGPEMLNVLFNTDAGRRFLADRTGMSGDAIDTLSHMGLSSLANIQAAIKVARHHDMNEHDVLLCMATDGAALYRSELEATRNRLFAGDFGPLEAAEVFGRCLMGCEPAHLLELTSGERQRIFNLGYYTWVEQRGISVADFDVRRGQGFWDGISDRMGEWDELIRAFNGAAPGE